MRSDPRDRGTYQITIASLGLALVVALSGAVLVASLDTDPAKTQTVTTTTTRTASTPSSRWKVKPCGCSKSIAVVITGTTSTDPASTPRAHPAPNGLYFVGAGLTGALLGILIPLSWFLGPPAGHTAGPRAEHAPDSKRWIIALVGGLLAVFAATVSLGVVEHVLALEILAATAGGALIGLFVPTPAMRTP